MQQRVLHSKVESRTCRSRDKFEVMKINWLSFFSVAPPGYCWSKGAPYLKEPTRRSITKNELHAILPGIMPEMNRRRGNRSNSGVAFQARKRARADGGALERKKRRSYSDSIRKVAEICTIADFWALWEEVSFSSSVFRAQEAEDRYRAEHF